MSQTEQRTHYKRKQQNNSESAGSSCNKYYSGDDEDRGINGNNKGSHTGISDGVKFSSNNQFANFFFLV